MTENEYERLGENQRAAANKREADEKSEANKDESQVKTLRQQSGSLNALSLNFRTLLESRSRLTPVRHGQAG